MASFFPSLRGLPKSYWFLWAGALLNRLGGFVFVFLALYLTEVRHLSIAQAGAVVGVCGMGSFLSGPVGGWLADRFGRRPAMLAGLMLGPCALLVLGMTATASHIAVAAFCYGFLGDLYRPCNHAMIADLVPQKDRARAFGFLYWAVNLGFSVASVIGGVMAHRNFMVLFILDASTTLGFAALVYLFVPETRVPVARAAGSTRFGALADLCAPLFDGSMVAFTLLSFLTACVFLQANVTLPIDMRAHGISTGGFGMLLAMNGVLIVLVSPIAIAILPRFSRGRVLAMAAGFAATGFGVNALVHAAPVWAAMPVYGGAIVIWTLGEILQSPVMPAVIADLAPADRRGVYQGFYLMSWGAASFVAPTIGSFVLERFGSTTLWAGCFGLGLVAAGGHVAFARVRHERVAQAAVVATAAAAQ